MTTKVGTEHFKDTLSAMIYYDCDHATILEMVADDRVKIGAPGTPINASYTIIDNDGRYHHVYEND